MLFNIVVPEFILGKAFADFLAARQCTKEIQDFQKRQKHEDEVHWTLSHSHLANMGGVFVKFGPSLPGPNVAGVAPVFGGHDPGYHTSWINELIHKYETGYPHLGPFDWNLHETHLKMAREYVNDHPDTENTRDQDSARMLIGDVWVLTAPQLLVARELGIIAKFPSITEARIKDKSKGDSLVTFTAVVQVAWLAIQLGIRAAAGRQSSQIEIMALAFAVCALITCLLLLQRPKDIQTPFVVYADRNVSSEEFYKISDQGFGYLRATYTIGTPSNPHSLTGENYGELMVLGMCAGLVAFGAIHLIAWNFQYPNKTERLLWRISALIVTFLPVAFGLLSHLFVRTDRDKWPFLNR